MRVKWHNTAGWCSDTQCHYKGNNHITVQGKHSSALGRFGSSFSWLHGTRPLYSPSHHLGPSKSPGFHFRAYLQCPTSTASTGLLLTGSRPHGTTGCPWPGSCSILSSSLHTYTSALEISPDCNLAQVFWIGKTLISTKFGINLCRYFYTVGMEKMIKRTTIFCKQYLHSRLQLEKDFAVSTEIVNIIDTSNPSLV